MTRGWCKSKRKEGKQAYRARKVNWFNLVSLGSFAGKLCCTKKNPPPKKIINKCTLLTYTFNFHVKKFMNGEKFNIWRPLLPTSFKSILNARSPLPHSSPIFPLMKLSLFVVYFQKEKLKKSIRRLKCLPQFQPLETTFPEERLGKFSSPLAVIPYL